MMDFEAGQDFLSTLKGRRSIYHLGKADVKDEEIESYLREIFSSVPSSFNARAQRVLLLLGNENMLFWRDLVPGALKERYETYSTEDFNMGKYNCREIDIKAALKEYIISTKKVIDELKNYVIYGLTFFKNSTNLTYTLQKSLLEFKNLERINLMGCLSEVCVLDGALGLRTYLDEINKDVEVCVYPDAIDTYDAPGHDRKEINAKAIAFMEANGIKILRKER